MSDDGLYLSDIYESIRKIEEYTKGGREAFMDTPMIQDAVIRNLEVIGEATKNLSDELRQANFDIRWKQIAGLRDVLIHGYMKVRLSRVWIIVEEELPSLKNRIEKLLAEIDCKNNGAC